ncbi:MAG TPA: histidine phosphatase family protein [Dehalococcoidia bacterium]|nr:histidine phosphatase family protein [Dehalococcoidia bacterium]
MRLLLLRHGESIGNAEWRLQGQLDYPLSPQGAAQARRLAEALRVYAPQALYASPVRRALETAQVVGEALGLEIQIAPGVAEYDFGELAGLTREEILERAPELEGLRDRQGRFPPMPGEEGREQFRRRVCDALWGLAQKHPQETVAVASHAGPIAVFCLEVLGLPYQRPIPLSIDNASITVIEVREAGRALLASLNDTCHLAGLE